MDSIVNFRDFGGYQAGGGKSLHRARLFRSAHHGDATSADLKTLSQLDIRLIVDLRRPAERMRQPSRRWQGCSAPILERSDSTEISEPPHLQFLATPGLTPQLVRERMIDLYREFPFDTGHVAIFRRYFMVLAQTDGAVLVHCTAGKDRTGLLVALTHAALGVSRDDLVRDFLATNEQGRLEERLPEIAHGFEKAHGRPVKPELLRQVMLADAAALDAAFDTIAAKCGSLDGYFHSVLEISPSVRDQIAARLLV